MPLRIVKIKNSPHWYIRGTVEGVSVFESTGTPDEAIADKKRVKLESELHQQAIYGVRKSYTFGEAAEKYLKAGGSARYLGTYDREDGWSNGPLKYFIETPLREINQTALDEAAVKAYPAAKPQSVNRQFYTPFVAVWNCGAQEDMCDARTWRRPRVEKADVKKTKWFRYKEAAQFFDALAEHVMALFLFYVYTGARPTEAIELDIKNVDLEARWAVLNATKTDNERGVPLHKAVIWMLRRVIGGRTSGRVFLTQAKKPYASRRDEEGFMGGGGYFKSAWATAGEDSGLSGYTPYSLRHTFNNWLILAGIDDTVREALMGHDNGSTNAIYSDVPQNHLIEKVDLLPDFTDFSHKRAKNPDLFTQNSTKSRPKNKRKPPENTNKISGESGAARED